jgi:SAM-dependent methyltransferase
VYAPGKLPCADFKDVSTISPRQTDALSANPDSKRDPRITYLSPPAQVSMDDKWFEIASVDHFWIRRRFEVFRQLAGQSTTEAKSMAEIGCGHGMLQRQMEDAYSREVAGIDLNDIALKQNVSRSSPLFCYDIYQRNANLLNRFDLIFLFDVIEHIADEDGFLDAVRSHLQPGARVVINVPAGMWAYSEYDRVLGHERRYSIHTLREAVDRNGFRVTAWTYWGLPLVPVLALRKLLLAKKQSKDKIVTQGFDSGSSTKNDLLGMISACEWIPQHFLGTSLMAVAELGVKEPAIDTEQEPAINRSHAGLATAG